MVGRQDLTLVLTDAKGQVLYAGPTAPPLRQTLVTRFEAQRHPGPVQATLTLDTTEDDRVCPDSPARRSRADRVDHHCNRRLHAGAARTAPGPQPRFAGPGIGGRHTGSPARWIGPAGARRTGSACQRSAGPIAPGLRAAEAFNADVAHELFTPLATLIGGTWRSPCARPAKPMNCATLGEHLEELQRMSLIVQDMLFLSQADRGAKARRETRAEPRRRRRRSGPNCTRHTWKRLDCVGVDGDAGRPDARFAPAALSNLIEMPLDTRSGAARGGCAGSRGAVTRPR